MEFIDKTIGVQRAHLLLKAFLDRCLGKNPYPQNLYDEMKNDVEPDTKINPGQKSTYRLLLEWILEESHLNGDGFHNDEGYCCYCMRKINAGSIHSTIEHVIPKTVDNIETYQKYFQIHSKLENDERIMALKTVFFSKYHSEALPCPHNVAYENLVASCDGSLPKGSTNHICCNGPRGDHYIPPLTFIPTIKNEIKYKKSGMVIWKDNPNMDKRECCNVINKELKLNNDILMIVRMIWCYLSEKGLDCTIAGNDRRRVIDTLRPKCQAKTKDVIQNFLENDNYWGLLEEYRYFNDITKFT